MNAPKSPPTSPLRDSPRNTAAQHTTTRSRSTTTVPLRVNKQDSPLTSTAIPNPSYHKLPAQLARRQSSSYNHVKNNALVSNSPFKRLARPSRIPTPTRPPLPTSAPDEENRKLDTESSKRRQSRGLNVLAKEQVVSKSPFLGDQKRSSTQIPNSALPQPQSQHYDSPRPLSTPEPLPVRPRVRDPSPEPAPAPAAAPKDAPCPSTPLDSVGSPVPVTPRNPRVVDLAAHTKSPSPKSSLASPKRLRGPRSQETSPTRQRRKTVTFDERCDVLEFDRDETEMDEEALAIDDDELYGPPEPPTKDGVYHRSQDSSFNSFNSDQPQLEYYDEHTPLFQDAQRVVGYEDEEYDNTPPTHGIDPEEDEYEEQDLQAHEASFDNPLDQRLSLDIDRSALSFEEPQVSPRLNLRLEHNASLDFTDTSSNPGENIGMDDLNNALDQLMLGVQSDLGDTSIASMPRDASTSSMHRDTSMSSMHRDTSMSSMHRDTSMSSMHRDTSMSIAQRDTSMISMQTESVIEADMSIRSGRESMDISAGFDGERHSYRKEESFDGGRHARQREESFDGGRHVHQREESFDGGRHMQQREESFDGGRHSQRGVEGTSSDGEDTEEPITPPGGQERSFAEDSDVFDNSIEQPSQHDEDSKDQSLTEHAPSEQETEEPDAEPSFAFSEHSGHADGASSSFQPPIDTSTPPASPRKEPHTPSHPHVEHYTHPAPHTLAKTLSLPPLSFGDNDTGNTILPDSWDAPLSQLAASLSEPNMGSTTTPAPSTSYNFRSQLPQPVRDNTFLVRTASIVSNASSIPPPVPPKDDLAPSARQIREEMIKAKRREIREAEDELDMERARAGRTIVTYPEGRPSKRRSLSTGDAEDMGSATPASQRRVRGRDMYLDIPIEQEEEERPLSQMIDQELKFRRKPTVKEKERMYKLRERQLIYASSDDKVSHMGRAGDVDSGKAWRTVRRPSDMNEYSRQIKEYRQQKGAKAHGKVFVKVVGFRGLNVPLPKEPTVFTCTLNNGIHSVVTPECKLAMDAKIEQEFELIEHSKLEFTLTLKVRRDPHIIAQVTSNIAPPRLPAPVPIIPVAPAPAPPSHRGMRSFFHSSPKKSKTAIAVNVSTVKTSTPPAPVSSAPPPIHENLARYLRPDGTLGRAFVSFKEVSKRCDAKLFETSFPLIGQRLEHAGPNAPMSPWTMGEVVLQMFRLPPLPGIPPEQLPQSLEECHRGLRHLAWHKVTYHEGVLTQSGGDCRTWRRRLLRVVGSSLIAFNDVTKKVTATIDLKKATAVEDDDPAAALPGMPSRQRDSYDGGYRVERSFRLIFRGDDEIQFFADTDEEKSRWLEVLGALVGHIPPNPLWAELVWQRQEEKAREALLEATAARAISPTSTSMSSSTQSSRQTTLLSTGSR
ncbi:hypothetical protein M422DRAFT_26767 [Sphaerobolus stellatus SS14]|nr:hypothetical protein M422DRAFT_26767 [Sphaerobolus stellatus SS14]